MTPSTTEIGQIILSVANKIVQNPPNLPPSENRQPKMRLLPFPDQENRPTRPKLPVQSALRPPKGHKMSKS